MKFRKKKLMKTLEDWISDLWWRIMSKRNMKRRNKRSIWTLCYVPSNEVWKRFNFMEEKWFWKDEEKKTEKKTIHKPKILYIQFPRGNVSNAKLFDIRVVIECRAHHTHTVNAPMAVVVVEINASCTRKTFLITCPKTDYDPIQLFFCSFDLSRKVTKTNFMKGTQLKINTNFIDCFFVI